MKAILLLISISLWILADSISYDSLKKEALKNTNIIKGAKLSIEAAQKDSEISLNLANPSIGFDANRYDEDVSGWSVGLSQPIRLPNFGNNLKELNSAKIEVAKATYLHTRALFLKELELAYTNFVYQKHLELLFLKELELAEKIKDIAKNRLQNGAGTKATYLRASIETQSVKNGLLFQNQQTTQYYFNLLSKASIIKEIEIEANFIYPITKDLTYHVALNPDLIKAEIEQKELNQEVKIANNSIKSIDLSVGFEKEPQDKIVSIGVGLVLPVFGISKQKTELARIKANQKAYKLAQLKIKQKLQKITLKRSLSTFNEQFNALKSQQIEQEKLLTLYEEGYQISKGSLLELLDVKNKLLKTNKSLLDTQKEANLKRIELNYIQGNYNE